MVELFILIDIREVPGLNLGPEIDLGFRQSHQKNAGILP